MDWTNEERRRAELAKRTPPEVAEVVAALSAHELLDISRGVVAELGVYELRLVKEERIGSKLLAPQTVRCTLRESPRAARLEYLEGPAKGRKVLYNAELRQDEMRVKEGGMLGLVGGMWIGLDNPLAKADTRHPVTAIGYGPLLDYLAGELRGSEPFGGHVRKDLGVDCRGLFSCEFIAPDGAVGLNATRARLTLDLALGLPAEVEAHDRQGLLERYRYELVRRRIDVARGFFEPKAFGL